MDGDGKQVLPKKRSRYSRERPLQSASGDFSSWTLSTESPRSNFAAYDSEAVVENSRSFAEEDTKPVFTESSGSDLAGIDSEAVVENSRSFAKENTKPIFVESPRSDLAAYDSEAVVASSRSFAEEDTKPIFIESPRSDLAVYDSDSELGVVVSSSSSVDEENLKQSCSCTENLKYSAEEDAKLACTENSRTALEGQDTTSVRHLELESSTSDLPGYNNKPDCAVGLRSVAEQATKPNCIKSSGECWTSRLLTISQTDLTVSGDLKTMSDHQAARGMSGAGKPQPDPSPSSHADPQSQQQNEGFRVTVQHSESKARVEVLSSPEKRLLESNGGHPASLQQPSGMSSAPSSSSSAAPVSSSLTSPNSSPASQHAASASQVSPLAPVSTSVSASKSATTPPVSSPPAVEGRVVNVLVIGKTGNGKSSLCNMLSGGNQFKVVRGMYSTTTEHQVVATQFGGKTLQVIDTPDISNLQTDDITRQQHVDQWKHITNSAPDVIFLAVRSDVRYTREEHGIYLQIKKLWGDNSAFRHRLVVAFTFADAEGGVGEGESEADREKQFRQDLQEVCQELKDVLQDARNRYIRINNKARDLERTLQSNKLHTKVNTVSTNEDYCLLVIGKSGHGKSTLANSIVGLQKFSTKAGLSPTTITPYGHITTIGGKNIKVIDTPDPRIFESHQKAQQVDHWKTLTAPEPSAILMVVRSDNKFSQDDYNWYKEVRDLWGRWGKFPIDRLVLVFTFTEGLEFNLEQSINQCMALRRVERAHCMCLDKSAPQDEKDKFLRNLLGFINTVDDRMEEERKKQPPPSSVKAKILSFFT